MAEFPVKGVLTTNQYDILDKISGNQENNQRRKSQVLDKDAFLKLMLTQLQHQNPLEPMDNSQQIAQMAQFSSVEQLSNIAKYQEQGTQFNALISKQLEDLTKVIKESNGTGTSDENKKILEQLVKMNEKFDKYLGQQTDKTNADDAIKALVNS